MDYHCEPSSQPPDQGPHLVRKAIRWLQDAVFFVALLQEPQSCSVLQHVILELVESVQCLHVIRPEFYVELNHPIYAENCYWNLSKQSETIVSKLYCQTICKLKWLVEVYLPGRLKNRKAVWWNSRMSSYTTARTSWNFVFDSKITL